MTELEARGDLVHHEEEVYREIYKWFQKNLRRPTTFTRSSKPHAKKVAISWFKESASEHIAKMREIMVILEGHGIHTEMIATTRPGLLFMKTRIRSPRNRMLTRPPNLKFDSYQFERESRSMPSLFKSRQVRFHTACCAAKSSSFPHVFRGNPGETPTGPPITTFGGDNF
jgi:hypothetical protein